MSNWQQQLKIPRPPTPPGQSPPPDIHIDFGLTKVCYWINQVRYVGLAADELESKHGPIVVVDHPAGGNNVETVQVRRYLVERGDGLEYTRAPRRSS